LDDYVLDTVKPLCNDHLITASFHSGAPGSAPECKEAIVQVVIKSAHADFMFSVCLLRRRVRRVRRRKFQSPVTPLHLWLGTLYAIPILVMNREC